MLNSFSLSRKNAELSQSSGKVSILPGKCSVPPAKLAFPRESAPFPRESASYPPAALYHAIRRGSLLIPSQPLSTSAYVNLIHERPTPSSATAMAMGVACRWKPPPLPGDAIILRSAAANRQPLAAAYRHTTITIFTAKAKDSPYASTSIIYITIKG